jgi:hypothetical protein
MIANGRAALCVILRSSLSPTLVSYRLTLGDDQEMTLYDPIQYELSQHGVTNTDIVSVHTQTVEIAEKRFANVNQTLLGRLREDGCRFNLLTVLNRDLSLSGLLQLDHASMLRYLC